MRGLSRLIILLGAALCVTTRAGADSGIGFTDEGSATNLLKPAADGFKGLFAAERFDMQHTIGLNFGTGSSNFSQYYLNTMTYKVSEPLTIQATLGVQNQSLGGSTFGQGASGARIIVPNVGVLYRPTKNLMIEFGFRNTPYYRSGCDPFWGRRDY